MCLHDQGRESSTHSAITALIAAYIADKLETESASC